MGNKVPSTRTLDSGEQVTHYPDGRQVLLQNNQLGSMLGAQAEQDAEAAAVLTEALVQAATDKREAQASGNPVSSDKRVV